MEVSQPVAHTSTYPNSRSLIQNFPTELLLIIFKFAYVAARGEGTYSYSSCSKNTCAAERKCFCYMEPSEECDEYCDDNEAPSLVLFTNSVASVCSRWRELMLLVPLFWTQIVVFLDDDIFPPENLKHQLGSSEKHPFEIVITRSSFSDAAGLKDIEHSRMEQIVATLRSHFHRCRTLRIEVIHSSSLPRLLAVLPPDMPHLRILSLESRIESGNPGVQPYCLLDCTAPFDWYKLKVVAIDGWNFAELDDHDPTSDDHIFSECRELSLKFGEISGTSISRLADGCPLELLNIDSITITPDVDSVAITQGGTFSDCFDTVILRNLGAESTNIILPYIHTPPLQLTIDNCPLPTYALEPETETLHLRNIGLDQSLGDFIRVWCGTALMVTRCPGFNDDVLDIMGSVVNDYNQRLEPELMKGLYIRDCHGFSVDALKELIEIKLSSPQGRSKLQALRVSQARFLISEEDIEWFKKRIFIFSWTT